MLPSRPLPTDDKSKSRAHAAIAPAVSQNTVTRLDAHLDPLLVYESGNTRGSPLVWDVALPPETLQVRMGTSAANGATSWTYFSNCAARLAPQYGGRPLQSLTLIVRTSSLHVAVKVPSGHTPPQNRSMTRLPYVSVWDVLVALYKALQTSVDTTTYRRLSRREQEAVDWSATLRASREAQAPQYSRYQYPSHVVKNVDFFGHGRRFLGLRPPAKDSRDSADLGRSTDSDLADVFVVEIGGG
ncbi:hypothetical protein C8Q73DRAFT_196835 [Cubamyces lactineus]|nr:hypothetical protein C8Q73DRAFT_196835 [Cubamyces lactineus]